MGTKLHPEDAMLREGLEKLGVDAPERIFSPLVRYIEEIELFNPAYGLVKVKDREELIVKHILDSLAPLEIIGRVLNERFLAMAGSGAGAETRGGQTVWHIADVGSGAGLPGIPLAVCMPGAEFTLIERMGRRAGFLRDALAVLGLSNVRVEETEMENFAQNQAGAGRFDLVVFRAFRPLEPAILRGLLGLLGPGGIIAAYKGRREAVEEEMARLFRAREETPFPSVGGWEALPLDVPFLKEERQLLLMRPGTG